MSNDIKTHTFNGQLDWQDIMKEAKGYKYVVMYRDHYRGNAKGDWFEADQFEIIYKQQPFWFTNTDRPVEEVILTDDDVPGIIEQRKQVIKKINDLRWFKSKIHIPAHPNCDGRATRRTQPEAFAEWDKAVAKAKMAHSRLHKRISDLEDALHLITYYSTMLYHIQLI